MFMLLHGADHGKGTPPCGRSEEVTVKGAAARDFYAFWFIRSNSMTKATDMLNNSIMNADYNYAAVMDG